MARVLVLNSGSSSVKYRLLDLPGGERLAGGLIERIGEPGGPPDHAAALQQVATLLNDRDLTAIGHRVVHGGEDFTAPTRIDDEVVETIRRLVPLAPLHNPANLAGIETALHVRPDLPQVAVFDTAFHSTLPPAAATYAIDATTARRLRIRRYGFHGTSHRYVSRRTAELLGEPVERLNTIVLHLGNGASACAVRGGVSVETSMGLSPLEGLVMGTRSGDLDPAVVFHLRRVGGMGVDEIDDLLNHHSGLAGLCGTNDMRDVLGRRADGDEAAARAFDVYCHRIRKYVGAYYATLGRLDAIAFTAGVGEHVPEVRAASLAGLDRLGVVVEPARNTATADKPRLISPDDAPVAVCVIPTDEELEIARETLEVVRR